MSLRRRAASGNAYIFSLILTLSIVSSASGTENSCTVFDEVTFCHRMEIVETNYTLIPPSYDSPTLGTINANFELLGYRSCEFHGGLQYVNFNVRMFGVSRELLEDYPSIVEVLIDGLEFGIESLSPVGRALISVDISMNTQVTVSELSEVFGIEGTLFSSGRLGTGFYLPLRDSINACISYARRLND